jgi:8-hydroxy-5-deazaflavin:NADPH oxidoreductase
MNETKKFDLAILGSGRVGKTVGKRLLQSNWKVTFGCRDSDTSCQRLSDSIKNPIVSSIPEAVRHADLVLLAVPWTAAEATCKLVADWNGKTLIDCTNPLNSSFSGLEIGFDTSAAEQISQWAPGADVVKTLNTASSELMDSPSINGIATNMFYCGGFESSKALVAKLLTDIGFAPVYCGPLQSARYLEPFAMLLIDMAARQGYRGKWSMQMIRESQ